VFHDQSHLLMELTGIRRHAAAAPTTSLSRRGRLLTNLDSTIDDPAPCSRGNVFGRLYITEETPVRGTDDEIVVRALAGATGIAIDNSRQYEKSRRRRRWLEVSTASEAEDDRVMVG